MNSFAMAGRNILPGCLFVAFLSLGVLVADDAKTSGNTPALEKNPYWPMCNSAAAEVIAMSDQDLVKDGGGLHHDRIHNVFWLSWALASPHSIHRDKPELLEKTIRVWDVIAGRLVEASAQDPDFDQIWNNKTEGGGWNHLPALESLRMLAGVSQIPPDKLAGWKEALHPFIEHGFRSYEGKDSSSYASRAAGQYPNADAQHAAAMMAASLVYKDDRYRQSAEKFVRAMEPALKPPGGWQYILQSAPVPLYHAFELIFLGRYYQLSHDPVAADQIRRTENYYPYVYAPEDTAEYTSCLGVKQAWNPASGAAHAAEFAAWLAGDGRNRWFADQRARRAEQFYWTLFCAEAWDEQGTRRAKPEPFPDAFIIPDETIDGLRGRFGHFSFMGSRAQMSLGAGGCFLSDKNVPGGFDSYLQFARLGIAAPGKENGIHHTDIRLGSSWEDSPVRGGRVIEKDLAALAVEFTPYTELQTSEAAFGSPSKKAAWERKEDWKIRETWLFTPRFVVAIFEATALQNDLTGRPVGIIRMGPFSRPHGLEGRKFFVGGLHGEIIQSDLPEVKMQTGAPDRYDKDKRVEIRLTSGGSPEVIPKGGQVGYAVAFSPDANLSYQLEKQKTGAWLLRVGHEEFLLNPLDDGGLTVSGRQSHDLAPK